MGKINSRIGLIIGLVFIVGTYYILYPSLKSAGMELPTSTIIGLLAFLLIGIFVVEKFVSSQERDKIKNKYTKFEEEEYHREKGRQRARRRG
ncbi:MAG: hypothetical protein Q8R00_02555 [Candidatus Nanoarchaeia archaeon]|nr:hypothetical protein [Candidatus Nanoarchaeia archaeon]